MFILGSFRTLHLGRYSRYCLYIEGGWCVTFIITALKFIARHCGLVEWRGGSGVGWRSVGGRVGGGCEAGVGGGVVGGVCSAVIAHIKQTVVGVHCCCCY